MQITLNIPDEVAAEVEARLSSEARARGLTLDGLILDKLIGSQHANDRGQRTVANAIDGIRKLRHGNRLNGILIKDLVEAGRRY